MRPRHLSDLAMNPPAPSRAPHPLYSVARIRTIEERELAANPPGTLMARAGKAAAAMLLQLFGNRTEPRILFLVGPGNNGGDALEAASLVADMAQASALCMHDPALLSGDARHAYDKARRSGIEFLDAADWRAALAREWDCIVDGLFGIGLVRPLRDDYRRLVETLNGMPVPVLALDVPSGLDADGGNVVGPDGVAVVADWTLTFIADKTGLHTGHGRDHCGEVRVAALDIDPARHAHADALLNHPALFTPALQPRRHNSHKGSFGDVHVLGGAAGMAGAAILSARAALHAGAGRVFAAFVGPAPAYDPPFPELMCRQAQELEHADATLVAGPGLGTGEDAGRLLDAALENCRAAVLDADALNLIALVPVRQQRVAQRCADFPCILTPHPLEAARLLGSTAALVQSDRLAAARQLAQRFGCVAVLKGSGTIIASPDGLAVINPTGNPGLASAGTGDVLAGLCGALLAQGMPAREAALAAVWLHGAAADTLVAKGIGPTGMHAGELMLPIRTCLNAAINAGATGAA